MSYSRMAFALASVMLTSLTAIVVGVALASRSSIPRRHDGEQREHSHVLCRAWAAETQKTCRSGKGSLVREVIDFHFLHLFCIEPFSPLWEAPQS